MNKHDQLQVLSLEESALIGGAVVSVGPRIRERGVI